MTQNIAHIGKAMTAIAAVLAFSSTPSLAQNASASPDPLAPEAATEAPAAPDPAAPTPPLVSKPKVETDPVSKPKVETAKTIVKTAKASGAPKAAKPAPRRVSAPAPVAVPVAAPAAQAEAPPPPPVDAIPPAPVEPTPVAEPAPPPAAETAGGAEAKLSGLLADDMMPIAGAGALGLLALGGAGLALRRRKRRREDEEFEARQWMLDSAEAEPVLELDRSAEVRPEPAFAAAPAIHDPVPDPKNPAAKSGFDPSRFGKHVQAAYRGPTRDNPSVSLEYRLRRAAAMDEQERQGAKEAVAGASAPSPADKPAWEDRPTRPDVEFMLGRGGTNR